MPPSAPLLAAFVVALAACAGSAPAAPAPAPARAAPLAVAGEAQAPVPSDPCALASGLPPLPAPALALELLQRAAMRDDRPTVGIPEGVMTRLGFASDSVPFTPHTPTLFLSTSIHADHHRPTDTPEKIDLDQIALTVRMVVSILEGV